MRRVGIVLSFIIAQVLTLIALVSPIWDQGWLTGFRNYFSNDQLSYAAIAVNVSQGNSPFVEPFTLQNVSFYPSLWYDIIGVVSRASGVAVYSLWNILGVAAICLTIALLGLIGYRLSHRAWAPILPALMLFIGTLSTITATSWYTSLDHHAVLWGAFGSFFTLNAEVIGICVNIIALATLAWLGVVRQSLSRKRILVTAGIAGGLIGITANIQTYNFFMGLTVLAAWVCAYGLMRARSTKRTALTFGLLLLAFIIGKPLSSVIGRVPIYALLLAALLPGALWLARRDRRLALTVAIPLVVLAAPQVLRTMFGLLTKDPFLTYRQASTADLSVPISTALIAGLPVILLAVACLIALIQARKTWLISAFIGLGFSWIVLTLNDLWGFAQEPYRFWLEGFIMTGFMTLTLLPHAFARPLSLHGDTSNRDAWPIGILSIGVVVVLISTVDFANFWLFARDQGVFAAEDARSNAIRQVLDGKNGMLAAAPCIQPGELKLITGQPVAHYNAGLAWPTNPDDYKILVDPDRRHVGDATALRAAQVKYVIADSKCDAQWTFAPQDRITQLREAEYVDGATVQRISLLEVLP